MEKTVFMAEDLQVGVASVTEKGIQLFLKVDPRIIMNALDEKFGALGWTKESTILSFNGQRTCKCTLSAKADGEWISRSDYSSTALWAGGNEFKVMDSDALRRAAMNFGVGRELYSFENIIIPLQDSKGNPMVNTTKIQETDLNTGCVYEKTICIDQFYVEQLKYDKEGKTILALSIKTLDGKRVFSEDRENTRLQGTIVGEENDVPKLKDARNFKAGIGSLAEKTLGELTKEELLHVWGQTRDIKIKKGCLVVANGNPEVKKLFTDRGINL